MRHLECSFDNITRLRNAVCHFGPDSTIYRLSLYDEMLRSVQYLAVLFGDERRAFEARAYRDKLVKQAEESVRNTSTIILLKELPFALSWDLDYARAFTQQNNGTGGSRDPYTMNSTTGNPKNDGTGHLIRRWAKYHNLEPRVSL
ncbi:hypothetical protein K449DRAFT_429415 [Hypoxylon sp. EC38]|nr:hypothetical protein K449DRAFT_429415 [Hypoxylon sp. EC38]